MPAFVAREVFSHSNSSRGARALTATLGCLQNSQPSAREPQRLRARGKPRPLWAAGARGRASSWRPPQCVVFSGSARRARGRAKRQRRPGGNRGGRCGARSRAAAAAAQGVPSVSARGRGGGAARGGGGWRRRRSAFEPGPGSEARSPPTGKWGPAWREELAARGSAGGELPSPVMAAGGKGGRTGSRRPGGGAGSPRRRAPLSRPEPGCPAAGPSAAPRPSPPLPGPSPRREPARPRPRRPGPRRPASGVCPERPGEGGVGPPRRPARPPRSREADPAGGGARRALRPGAGLCCEGSRGVRPTWRRSAERGQWPALPSGPSPHRPGGRTGRLGRPWPPLPAPDPGSGRPRPRERPSPTVLRSSSRSGPSLHCAVGRMQPPPLFMSLERRSRERLAREAPAFYCKRCFS